MVGELAESILIQLILYKMDRKFIYNKIGFKLLPSIFCFHSSYIKKGNFNITVRGFIFYDRKLIYIRINPNAENLFNLNLKKCLKYLKKEYPKYKIYDSYKIDKIPKDMRYLLT